jgi:Sigma-70, region 4
MPDWRWRRLVPRGWRIRVRGFRAPRAVGDGSWTWLEPYPGPLPGPGATSMSLAFIAVLQRLPPEERAALTLSDVHDFSVAEIAEMLGCEYDVAERLLSRARAALDGVLPEHVPDEDAVVSGFTSAFERGDVAGITALLARDAWLRMRPLPLQFQGRKAARRFLGVFAFPGGLPSYRLIATRANGQPAFGCYLRDHAAGIDRACGLIVLTVDGGRITAIDRFVDNSLLPRFGLPRTLPEDLPGSLPKD